VAGLIFELRELILRCPQPLVLDQDSVSLELGGDSAGGPVGLDNGLAKHPVGWFAPPRLVAEIVTTRE
jgi:hypothetical protein